MARGLAKTGSPLYNPEVQNFQGTYNVMVRTFGQAPRGGTSSCKPGVIIGSLVEDGQYGPMASTGLQAAFQAVMRSPPPCKAVDFPTWYAQNADLIDTWAPHGTDAVEVVGPTAAANTVLTEAKTEQSGSTISAQDAGGAGTQTIQQTTAVPTSAPTTVVKAPTSKTVSLCTAWGGSAGRRCAKLGFEKFVKRELAAGKYVTLEPNGRPRAWIKRTVDPTKPLCNMFTNAKNRTQCRAAGFEAYVRARLLQGDAFKFTPKPVGAHAVDPAAHQVPATHVDIEEPVHVVVAPVEGKVPFLAIGVGMLALGGLLYAFTRPKRHA